MLVVSGLALEVGFAILARLTQPAYHPLLLLGVYAVLFILLIGLCLFSGETLSRSERYLLWGFAVLFRITLWVAPPTLSDDIYRYSWEGRAQRAGLSPYHSAPAAPEAAFLHGDMYALVGHKTMPAIYPPLTQFMFRFGSRIADALTRWRSPISAEVMGQKCVFLLFDLLTIGILGMLLKQRGRPETWLIYYAWNPLVVLEFAGSGHNDSLGIFFLLLGLWACCRAEGSRTDFWGSAALAASFLAKYTSVLLVPYLVWRRRWKILVGLAIICSIGLVFSFGWRSEGQSPWDITHGVRTYLLHWQFNGSIFAVFESLLGRADWAKRAMYGLIGIAAVGFGFIERDIVRAAYWLIALSLLLAPTVYPWYFIWLIPFLCLFPNPAFLLWNGTIMLSYTVLHRYAFYHVWDLHPAILWLEYLPVYALLIWQWMDQKRQASLRT